MSGWTRFWPRRRSGLATTSSSFLGAVLGLYVPISKRALACILAFAAGSLISALAIELAFEGAQDLHHHGFTAGSAWGFIGGGFALGATIYYAATIYLEERGAAVRYQTRFQRICAGAQAARNARPDRAAVEMRSAAPPAARRHRKHPALYPQAPPQGRRNPVSCRRSGRRALHRRQRAGGGARRFKRKRALDCAAGRRPRFRRNGADQRRRAHRHHSRRRARPT